MKKRIRYSSDGRRSCEIDGREVSQEEFDELCPSQPGIPSNLIMDQDWSSENNGRGRFIGQVGGHEDPRSYHHNPSSAIEEIKRRGGTAERI